MKPGDITSQFVHSRFEALKSRWSERNSRMDEMERLYLLDMWQDAPEPDERRISAPVCWNIVESFRTLLLTRPPVISVPASEVKAVETDRADQIEKYLYGAWHQAHVSDALHLAEWHASCLGEGVLRCVYDPETVEDEFPLVVQALDPRTVYATPSGRQGQDLEVVHSWERPRREIEAEWGLELPRPSTADVKIEEWLDEEVEFIDYWRVDVEQTTEKVSADKGQEKPKPVGVLASLVAAARKVLGAGAAPAELVGPEGAGVEAEPGAEAGVEAQEQEQEQGKGEAAEVAQPTRRTVRRRVVTNCVVVEDTMVKEPVRMPGYGRLPFVRYPGISTPLADENGALSVLFAITGGTRQNGAIGLSAAMNELLAMKQRIIETFANGAIMTDDETLTLNLNPGSINYIRKGAQWSFLMPPGPHPAVDQQIQLMERMVQDATVSASMMGRYQGDMSGLMMSAINNPVLMRIAHRQQVRERAYEALNEIVLELTEEYAPAEGWYVWGEDRLGGMLELRLKPAEIGGYHRNRVELSASLPKDEAGEVMSLANLVGQKLISRETFLDQLQRIKHLSGQSPQDEMKRILRDQLLFEGPTAETLAKVVLSEWSEELATAMGLGPKPPAPPMPPMPPMAGSLGAMPPGMPPGGPGPGGPPPGPPGAPGQGPMQGMPSSVVPPGQIPEMIGAQNLPGMLRMQGEEIPEELK